MSVISRSTTSLLLVFPFVIGACGTDPTGLGDPGGRSGGLGAPEGSAGDSGGSSGSTGSGSASGDATGYARVSFSQSGDALAEALAAEVAARLQARVATAQAAALDEGQIESIEFTLTSVQLHRLGVAVQDGESAQEEESGSPEEAGEAGESSGTGEEDEEETEAESETEHADSSPGVSGASWVTVELAEGTTLVIDLTALPTADDGTSEGEAAEGEATEDESGEGHGPAISATGGLEIAAGELPAGSYRNVRLLGEATITFSEDLIAGNVQYTAGETYVLEIPSSQTSGVKVQTPRFEIAEGGAVSVMLVFDGPESIKKIKLNAGGAKMVPVMRASVEVGAAASGEPAEAPEASES